MEQDLGEAIDDNEACETESVWLEDDQAARLAHENVLGFAVLMRLIFAAAEGP